MIKSLEQAAEVSNDGEHAHHIVASTHWRAADARDILEEFDVVVNSAINGVFVDEIYHSTLHTHAKIDSIILLIMNADSKSEIISILANLKNRIKNKSF